MPIFIIGHSTRRFSVGPALVIMPAHEGRTLVGQGRGLGKGLLFTNKKVKIAESISIRGADGQVSGYYGTNLKRGVAQESKDFYARVLPADAEPRLAELDAEIEAAHEEVKRLYQERHEFIATAILRGEVITKKHVAPKV